MSEQQQQTRERNRNLEEQVNDLIRNLEDQDAQVWAYVIGGVVALLAALVAAYFYSQSVRERRKSTLEKVKDTLRGALPL